MIFVGPFLLKILVGYNIIFLQEINFIGKSYSHENFLVLCWRQGHADVAITGACSCNKLAEFIAKGLCSTTHLLRLAVSLPPQHAVVLWINISHPLPQIQFTFLKGFLNYELC